MADATTLDTLLHLQRQMAAEGRSAEERALRDAVACLSSSMVRGDGGLLTTGEAARLLGVSISTIKRWVGRGVLRGVDTGTRWLVEREGAERVLRIRATLAEMDDESNPTPEEFALLRRRGRQGGGREVA